MTNANAPAKRPTPPEAIERAYELWLWLDAHVVNLPAHARTSVGARVLDTILALLDGLLVAAYAPARSAPRAEALTLAHGRVTLLRYLLRGMHDRRYLSHEQHAFVVDRVDALARRISGWRSASR